jgi:ribosomal RNA assembly protein
MHVRIPRERIGVLIGPDGSVKQEIERRSGIKLRIDSETGEVRIEGEGNPLGVLQAREVVRAIGRGFSPQRALRLFQEDQYLDIIDIRDFAGDSEKALRRIKGRVIGERGRTRETIERLTGTYVSVYGKTVALIGSPEELRIARAAVEMLLRGSQHSSVYRFLERKKKEMKSGERTWK